MALSLALSVVISAAVGCSERRAPDVPTDATSSSGSASSSAAAPTVAVPSVPSAAPLEVAPATAAPAATASAATAAEAMWMDVFAIYPGARKLCWQHVVGNPMHIHWEAYATTDMPAKVAGYYRRYRGATTEVTKEGSELSLHGPDRKILSIHSRAGSYPTCDTRPAATDQTVIIVSQAIGG
jgi:hypothetical protein